MTQWLRAHSDLLEVWAQLPAFTWLVTSFWNYNSKEPDAFSWPQWVSGQGCKQCTEIFMEKTITHKIRWMQIQRFIFLIMCLPISVFVCCVCKLPLWCQNREFSFQWHLIWINTQGKSPGYRMSKYLSLIHALFLLWIVQPSLLTFLKRFT